MVRTIQYCNKHNASAGSRQLLPNAPSSPSNKTQQRHVPQTTQWRETVLARLNRSQECWSKCGASAGSQMEGYLRQWRQDAASRNLLETAIFIGDKALALTSMLRLFCSSFRKINTFQITTKMHYDSRNSTRPSAITLVRLGFL